MPYFSPKNTYFTELINIILRYIRLVQNWSLKNVLFLNFDMMSMLTLTKGEIKLPIYARKCIAIFFQFVKGKLTQALSGVLSSDEK